MTERREESIAQRERDDNARHRHGGRRRADTAQVRETVLETDPKEQEDDADLRDRIEDVARSHPAESVGADGYADEELAEDRRLPQTDEDFAGDARQHEDDEQ